MPDNYDQIMAEKSWTVQEFNGGSHLRINGVIDVWPRKRRWRPSRTAARTLFYADIPQLKKIVREAGEAKTAALARIAARPVERTNREPVKQLSREEFERLFG